MQYAVYIDTNEHQNDPHKNSIKSLNHIKNQPNWADTDL
jgi:hypothetical protein